MKNLVVGILAHVDAGKTTLSEALLYTSGAIDKLGRVDKRDTYLDTHSIERERGITIFSKQAVIDTASTHITLIDTPGHVDFSCETERALSIQDYAILVISAEDGVRSHTKTLWELVRRAKIPTFIFVNKCDISNLRRDEIMSQIKAALSPYAVDFTAPGTESFYENIASCDERLMPDFFDTGAIGEEKIARAVNHSRVFPCFFGSALKLVGIAELLSGIDKYTEAIEYSKDIFGAKVFKITRDKDGRRLCFAKITGGTLAPKDTVTVRLQNGEEISEKVEQLRIFSGEKSKPERLATPGNVVAIIGPESIRAGMGLGFETDDVSTLSPVLDYRMILPKDESPHELYARLSVIAEEDPALNLSFDTRSREIRVSLMGEIQLEVLKRLISERTGIAVEFDEGSILYRETIDKTVQGAGHFEPLRHYAEVHLRLDPLPEGSGVIAGSDLSRDVLALNWQRLVMTHIDERVHRGTSLGAPLTDVAITLIGGRAHNKHTEGGDFRQATYRAIRQALRKGGTVVLEPTFDFKIELPYANLGRALTDISNMHGTVTNTETVGDVSIVEGNCPVYTMRSYPAVLRAYTRGFGKITLTVGKYVPAHNQEEVILARGYNPDTDERNPCGSVFCRAGAGYPVPWDEADALMHVRPEGQDEEEGDSDIPEVPMRAKARVYGGTAEEDKELMRIFEATYGKIKPRKVAERVENKAKEEPKRRPVSKKRQGSEYIVLDGYNVIFGWDELKRLAEADFSLGRDALIRIVCNYAAVRRVRAIIVFDAYKRAGGEGSTEILGPVTVVYTKEKQTADTYIERATYELAGDNLVRVVTGDLDEQFVILGNGAYRVSTEEFKLECEAVTSEISELVERFGKSRK